MKTVLAQIEIRTGDLDGNTQKIKDVIAEYDGTTDVIVFPELAITGYNCGALFEYSDFVDEAIEKVQEIAVLAQKSTVIVGGIRYAKHAHEKSGEVRLHNSAYVIQNGKIIGVYDKIHLANAYQHEDRKYFIPGNRFVTFIVAGKQCGVLICEDIWATDHDRNLVAELKDHAPELEWIFSINFSYGHPKKFAMRSELMRQLTQTHNVGIVYVNTVGIGDILKNYIVYDGQTLVYNKHGIRIFMAEAFKEEIAIVHLEGHIYKTNVLHKHEYIWNAELYAMPKILAYSGVKKALVAMSGGIDSAIAGVLAVKALGAENVIFVSMPTKDNGSITKGNAQYISDKLGVELKWINIQAAVEELSSKEEISGGAMSTLTSGTLQATLRASIALSMCNTYGAGIISTGNHTENVLGWCTFHDIGSIGVYQPFGDLTKLELYDLAEYVNRLYKDILIPEGLYNGEIVPMAELADAKEDPFDYYLMSGICASIIRERKTPVQIVCDFISERLDKDYFQTNKDKAHYVYDYDVAQFRANVYDAWNRRRRSVYKGGQHAPNLILSERAMGFSTRETLINFWKVQ